MITHDGEKTPQQMDDLITWGTGKYYCGECDHVETDDIFLDTETCSICGGLLDFEAEIDE